MYNLNNIESKTKCEICRRDFDSEVELKAHVKLDHLKNTSTQTDDKVFVEKKTQVNHSELEKVDVSEDQSNQFLVPWKRAT